MNVTRILLSAATVMTMFDSQAAAQDLHDRVEHHYADNDGVRIHYVTLGQGPLVVMIHGFPDFWYSWRHQMEALSQNHRVAALDMRGYNRSDRPKGVDSYGMTHLVADVAAVVRDAGEDEAIIVGHDWGGMVAWTFAMQHPEQTAKLIILNLPHPRGLSWPTTPSSSATANTRGTSSSPMPTPHSRRRRSPHGSPIPAPGLDTSRPSGVLISRPCSTTTRPTTPGSPTWRTPHPW